MRIDVGGSESWFCFSLSDGGRVTVDEAEGGFRAGERQHFREDEGIPYVDCGNKSKSGLGFGALRRIGTCIVLARLPQRRNDVLAR